MCAYPFGCLAQYRILGLCRPRFGQWIIVVVLSAAALTHAQGRSLTSRHPIRKPMGPVAYYFFCRAKDFGDLFRAQAGKCYGLHVDVEATDLVHMGVGAAKGVLHGWMGRACIPVEDTVIAFPISNVAAAARNTGTTPHPLPWSQEMQQFAQMIAGLFRFHVHRQKMAGQQFTDECYGFMPMFLNASPDMLKKRWLQRFQVQVGATAVFVGVRVGFSLGQFADLLTGIVGFDLARDDPPRLPDMLRRPTSYGVEMYR